MAASAPPLFTRQKVTRHDQRVFLIRLLGVAVLLTAGITAQIYGGPIGVGLGVLILACTYTHMVELQHQCLHHSAFRTARWHRIVGVPLGLPLLVSYSDYRVRHLQHHRFLGTPNDSEFFGFDTRQPITWKTLLLGAFDYIRLVRVLNAIGASILGRWTYTSGQISPRRRADVIQEYRLMAILLTALIAACALGAWQEVLLLWFVPLLLAAPIHFLVELPEHVLCEADTDDVLRNTRSITGSRLSTWFTNGNNLHVEHHAAMAVPLNRLRARHSEVLKLARHVDHSYPDFYWRILKIATHNTLRTPPARTDTTTTSAEQPTPQEFRWLRF
ncbi:fatty acid desaturase [Gordonia sp. CPCC 206044]|uniref:fatty acid desaturase family protein n=1 Tax=Gordonia sp. CPCC 206044 TaxID=3140793 RepID=UPI003AF3B4AC